MLRKIFYYFSDLIPGLGALLSKIKYELRFVKKPKNTIHGFLLSGTKNMIEGSFETDETNFIIEIAKNYDRFINVGANVGYYIALAQHLGIKEIFGFEPNPTNFHLLSKNAVLSKHQNTRLFNLAVGDVESELQLYGDTTGASLVPGWSGSSQKLFTNVKVVALDNFLEDHLLDGNNLLLIDIEGYEFQALQGMKRLLEVNNFDIIVEICYKEHWTTTNPYFNDTFEFFNKLGYKCFSLHDKTRIPLSNYYEFKIYAETHEDYHNYFFSKNI